MLSRSVKFKIWRFPPRRALYRLVDVLRGVAGFVRNPTDEEPYQAPQGPFPVVRETHAFLDETRDIKVSCELFRPETLSGPHPVVIFCPGLPYGPPGSELGQGVYLCEHFAAHGYLALLLSHTGNDARMLADMPKSRRERAPFISSLVRRDENVPSRTRDISYVIDMLESWNREDGALRGHIDCSRIGMFGYCLGGRTSLVAMGELWGADRQSYKDSRIKAGVICSFSPVWQTEVPHENLAEIDVPTLTITGSRDYGMNVEILPEDRAAPFHATSNPGRFLLMLSGADHVVFSGKRNGKPLRPGDPRKHQLIKNVSLAFWDAYLKDDSAARQWLDQECDGVLGREAELSRK